MLKDVQKKVDDALKDYEKPYWEPLSNFARLAEEVGEVGRVLNHLYGEKPKKPTESEQDLGEELADVIFACVCLANSHDIDLDEGIDKAIEKLHVRDANRFKLKNHG